jgi:hypothetical protein
MKKKLKEGCCENVEGQAWNSKRGDKRKGKINPCQTKKKLSCICHPLMEVLPCIEKHQK